MPRDLVESFSRAARPLAEVTDWDALAARLSHGRVVLLGEASHGTREYYEWRTEVTLRLLARHRFDFVAVEGDWPDCFRMNAWLKGRDARPAAEVLRTFVRWPTWMWANHQVEGLMEGIRSVNLQRSRPAGLYGLDVYSLRDSLRRLFTFIRQNRPEAMPAARRAAECFDRPDEGMSFARRVGLSSAECEGALHVLRERVNEAVRDDGLPPEAEFDAEQNARVTVNAERYYRVMMTGNGESWNVRDHHMIETLDELLAFHGSAAKGIVWAHNTHIGDARATDMAEAGLVSLGQLARQRWGTGAVLVGAGSRRGTVVAGREWDAPWEVMETPPTPPGSWEALLEKASPGPTWWDVPVGLAGEIRTQRAIGVVYRPDHDDRNHVPTDLARRYDVLIQTAATTALDPLRLRVDRRKTPKTFPSGV